MTWASVSVWRRAQLSTGSTLPLRNCVQSCAVRAFGYKARLQKKTKLTTELVACVNSKHKELIYSFFLKLLQPSVWPATGNKNCHCFVLWLLAVFCSFLSLILKQSKTACFFQVNSAVLALDTWSADFSLARCFSGFFIIMIALFSLSPLRAVSGSAALLLFVFGAFRRRREISDNKWFKGTWFKRYPPIRAILDCLHLRRKY